MHIDDLSTETRWPNYRFAALDRTPVRSIVSFRLFGDGKLSAALNLYAESAGAFDDESVELGLVFRGAYERGVEFHAARTTVSKSTGQPRHHRPG